ncbi:MAG TPA: hypothetical protein VMK12_09050 [Anaeromyxobacteraceae bacterium]|nr:hypothetical protein [Anaeromyxobacteraceae bacterium]
MVVLPGDPSHLHWARSGEYATQANGIEPLGIEYLETPKDDERNER